MLYVCLVYYKHGVDTLIVKAKSREEAMKKVGEAMNEAEYSCRTIVAEPIEFNEAIYRHPDIAFVYEDSR